MTLRQLEKGNDSKQGSDIEKGSDGKNRSDSKNRSKSKKLAITKKGVILKKRTIAWGEQKQKMGVIAKNWATAKKGALDKNICFH